MVISIPLGSLRNMRDGQLMPDKFTCVFKDAYKVFLKGRPKELGVRATLKCIILYVFLEFSFSLISADRRVSLETYQMSEQINRNSVREIFIWGTSQFQWYFWPECWLICDPDSITWAFLCYHFKLLQIYAYYWLCYINSMRAESLRADVKMLLSVSVEEFCSFHIIIRMSGVKSWI